MQSVYVTTVQSAWSRGLDEVALDKTQDFVAGYFRQEANYMVIFFV